MNRNVVEIALGFGMLVLVAYFIDQFHDTLESHHDKENPIEEISEWDYRPKPYTGICPNHRKGELQDWVDCYRASKMWRTDI